MKYARFRYEGSYALANNYQNAIVEIIDFVLSKISVNINGCDHQNQGLWLWAKLALS